MNPVPENRGDRPRTIFTGTPDAESESPSLAASAGEIPAYELKFLLTETQAAEVEERARRFLFLDPHADPVNGNGYATTSIYCDTSTYDVFHRRGAGKRRKHRLRSYNQAAWVFLERKIKWGDRVKKLRTMIPDNELPRLALGMSATTWPGHWFHRYLLRRGLSPVCRIAYDRLAFVGRSAEGPMRLTLDRRIRGVLAGDWDLGPLEDGRTILTNQVICEFKYQVFLPSLFKEILQAMQLTPRPVSKYRTFLRHFGPPGQGGTADA
jgi:hypothetical protein